MEFNLAILLLLTLSAADVQTLKGCSVEAEVGETVILHVKVDLTEDSELLNPIISWVKESGGIVHDYWYDKDYNEHQADHFKGRTSLFNEEIKKGDVSLKIINVTKTDEGKYTCEVLYEDKKTYNVSLCVMEKSGHKGPPKSPNPDHSSLIPGLIVGTVIGVLVGLAALIGAICLYKRRTLTEKTPKGIYPGAGVETEKLRGGDP